MTTPPGTQEPQWTWAIDYDADDQQVMIESRRLEIAIVTREQWNTAIAQAVQAEILRCPNHSLK